MERRLNFFWPLVMIALGALWIMIQAGVVPAANLWALATLWPILLIAAGLGLILRRYWSFAGLLMSVLSIGGLFLAIVFAAQLGFNRVPIYAGGGDWWLVGTPARGSGHVVSESRQVSGFATIRIDYPAEVTIHQGSTESLTIEAEDNVVRAIRTQILNGVLQIENIQDHNVYIQATRPVKIAISVKSLKQVDFHTAGELTLQGVRTPDLKLLMDGAGSVKVQDLQAGSLEAVLSGVGSLEASGTAEKLDARVEGMGSLNGAQLRSQAANVILDGLGSADVWADDQLTATVNGLGSVNYYGNAKVTKSVNGLGTVNFKGTK